MQSEVMSIVTAGKVMGLFLTVYQTEILCIEKDFIVTQQWQSNNVMVSYLNFVLKLSPEADVQMMWNAQFILYWSE